MTSHIATISISYLQIAVHSLIPSTAETTTGSLWRARLHSPPSLLTNTFRHSDQVKHSRSCLGQLLQVPKIPSQRAPTITMPTFNCDGSVSPLLSSWPVVPHPICESLAVPAQVTQRSDGDGTWLCPQKQPQNPATPELQLDIFLTDLSLLSPQILLQIFMGGSQQKLWAQSCKPSVTGVRVVSYLHWHLKQALHAP